MTYQGARARPMDSENGRVFEVSKVRIGTDGHVSDVLWGEVDAGTDHSVGAPIVSTAAEVMDAIHDGARVSATFAGGRHLPERAFVIVELEDGRECIALEGAPAAGRNLSDVDTMDG